MLNIAELYAYAVLKSLLMCYENVMFKQKLIIVILEGRSDLKVHVFFMDQL